MKNLKQFNELILKYESITLEEIEAIWIENQSDGRDIAKEITGFGTHDCMLCRPIDMNCEECTWSHGQKDDMISCISDTNHNIRSSYHRISEAIKPEQLLRAFKARAKVMRKHIRNIQ